MKQKNSDIIEGYYKSVEYNDFIQTQLRTKDSEKIKDSISNQLTLENILKVYYYLYKKIDKGTFPEVSITIKELLNEMNIRNQTITIILNILININIIKQTKSKNKKHSHKYKLIKNTKKHNMIDTILLPITFNDNIQEIFRKTDTRLKVQKHRNQQSINEVELSIKIKTNKKKRDKLEDLVKLQHSIKLKQNKLKRDKQIVKDTIKNNGIYSTDFKIKDQDSGRIGHLLINMNKEYRDYILINNNNTISIDFSNFQPYILSERLINNDDYKDYEDVILFNELCKNGVFYDYVAKINMATRDEIKKLWMKVAYGREYINAFGEECEVVRDIGKLLHDIFPNVVTFLDNVKQGKGKDYVSNWLCELESDIINPLSDNLYNNSIFNITIYDEFVLEYEHMDEALKIINEHLLENNIKAKVKISNIPITDISNINSNESKDISNTIHQKTTECPSEVKYEGFTKQDYIELLETKDWWIKSSKDRLMRENTINVLNMLVEKQLTSTKEIKEEIQKYFSK